MGYAHEYATAILRRGRVPMEPGRLRPGLGGPPAQGQVLPRTPRRSRCPDRGCRGAGHRWSAACSGRRGTGAFTLPLLGGMLRDSYGLIGRRLAVQANTDLGTLPSYTHANWSRGTASGGGLYPIGVHWVAGAGGPVTPGVYYYATPHHGMQPAAGRRRHRRGAARRWADLPEAADTPVPGARRQVLAERLQVQQLLLPRRDDGHRRPAADLADVGRRPRPAASAPPCGSTRAGSAACSGSTRAEDGVFAVVPLHLGGGTAGRVTPDAPDDARRRCRRGCTGPTRRARTPSVRVRDRASAMHTADRRGRRGPARAGALDGALALPAPPGGERVRAARRHGPLDAGVRTRPARPPQQLRPVPGHPTAAPPTSSSAVLRSRRRPPAPSTATSRPPAPGRSPGCTSSSTTCAGVPQGVYEYDRGDREPAADPQRAAGRVPAAQLLPGQLQPGAGRGGPGARRPHTRRAGRGRRPRLPAGERHGRGDRADLLHRGLRRRPRPAGWRSASTAISFDGGTRRSPRPARSRC